MCVCVPVFFKKVFCKQFYLLNQPGGTEKLRFWPGLWMVMLATMSSDSKCLWWGMEIFLPSTSLLLQLSYLDSKQDISAVNLIILLLKNSEIGMSEHYFTDQYYTLGEQIKDWFYSWTWRSSWQTCFLSRIVTEIVNDANPCAQYIYTQLHLGWEGVYW